MNRALPPTLCPDSPLIVSPVTPPGNLWIKLIFLHPFLDRAVLGPPDWLRVWPYTCTHGLYIFISVVMFSPSLYFFPHTCRCTHNVHCSIVAALGVNSFRSVFSAWRPRVIHQFLWGPVDQISLEQPSLISTLALRITGLSFTLFIYVLSSYQNDKSHADNSRISLWKVVLVIILWPYAELSVIWWINSPLHA